MRRTHALLCAVLTLAVGCSTNRVTGELDHNYYSEADELALGETTMRDAVAALRRGRVPVDADRATLTLLRAQLKRLAAVTEYGDEFPWAVHLAETRTANAWCAPGGRIMVYRGLLQGEAGLVACENELAGVLAHEVAHATCRHVTRARSRRISLTVGLFVPYLALSLVAPEAAGLYSLVSRGGAQLYEPVHSREAEREADRQGLIYMARAGFDPRVMPGMWRRAAARRPLGLVDALYATHPGDADRAEQIEALLPDVMPLYVASRSRRSPVRARRLAAR